MLLVYSNPPNVLHPMERVGTLINKLKEQFEQHADAEKLSVTAQLLLAALQQQPSATVTRGKVSVVLPAFNTPTVEEKIENPAVVVAEEQPTAAVPNAWLFEAPAEIPTLVHQELKEVFELNETMLTGKESMNERLKEERHEVAAALQGTPVRDLKKAIGVNDRYLFLNDLFRGDESMYERCMKTINAFSIYPEAQYWIERELKVKMGWNDQSDTVKLFDQLVKRRFS